MTGLEWTLLVLVILLIIGVYVFWGLVNSLTYDLNIFENSHTLLRDKFEELEERCNKTFKYTPPSVLDQEVTLDLHGGVDGYLQIRSNDIYAKAWTIYNAEGDSRESRETSRTMTLRELLNRIMKDCPVELIHEVKPDWKFKDEEQTPPIVIHVDRETLYPIDNRTHPLAPGPLAPGKPVFFNAHDCGLDTAVARARGAAGHGFPLHP